MGHLSRGFALEGDSGQNRPDSPIESPTFLEWLFCVFLYSYISLSGDHGGMIKTLQQLRIPTYHPPKAHQGKMFPRA